ncbi:hypothetical protein [Streptomyces antibioticus]|uniref:hypothetical protein n=1 Tax=Streptomyces antibioticus TaxID=1890 RepID=UPI0033DFC1B1
MAKPMIVMPTVASPVRRIDAAGASAFVERVFDASRLQPLVLISTARPHGDRPLIDPYALYEEVGEHAEIAVIADERASWALSDQLPGLSVWGGAVRIYLPDATREDPWHRHPVIKVDPHRPRLALGQIVARIRSHAGLPAPAPAPLVVVPAPRRTPEPPVIREQDERREAELTRLAGQLTEKERRLREKDETIAGLRQQLQKAGKQLRAVARDADTPAAVPTVYADPERQFRYEVEQLWLWTVPETERDEHPLASYRLGRDWLTSMEMIELVDRRKILDVTVEVLTGRAVDSAARRLRRMRSSDGGDSGPRVRGDGAVAWRCDLKQGASSAPRLMYWKLPDGTIELAKVAAHDDMSLR